MARVVEVGERFGRLTVASPAPTVAYHRHHHVLCDCGTHKIVRADALLSGATQSCGCLAREVSRRSGSHTTHGGARRGRKSPTYIVWQGMRQRCQDPNVPTFRHYGGRGITVCKRWDRYENFLADMGERPPGLSLDRVDNDGNYEPSNCRWATRAEQRANQRERPTQEPPPEPCGPLGCLIWRGKLTARGYPIKKDRDGRWRLARRVIYEERKRPLQPGEIVKMDCGERLCVHEAHMVARLR